MPNKTIFVNPSDGNAVIEAVRFNNTYYILNKGKVVGECYKTHREAVKSKIYQYITKKYLNSEEFEEFLDVLSDWN